MASLSEDKSFKRISTGVAGLDIILGGGFFQGGMYIIQGAPGAGKTILSNQLCFHHAGAGGRALFVTLLAENHARMLQNLRELSFFREDRIPDQVTYLSVFRELRDAGLKGLIDLFRREIQRRRTTMLVVDGLISVQRASESDQVFKEFVHDLQEIALATDCTMFLTTSAGSTTSPEQTMVDGLIELADRYRGARTESSLEIRKLRGSGFLRGAHSYEITRDGFIVHPRIEALLAAPSRPGDGTFAPISTGNDRLDKMLGAGVPVGSHTIMMGPSGIGKTTLGLQFLAQSSEREPGLLFTFHETAIRLRAKAAAVAPKLVPLLDSGEVELLSHTPNANVLDAYGKELLDAIERRGVKRLFIDGLTSFKNIAADADRVGHFFTALANELRGLGVTTYSSLEIGDILGLTVRIPLDDLGLLADNIILLRYVELRSRLHRLISIIKVRDSDFDPTLHVFTIAGDGAKIDDTPEYAENILSSLYSGAEFTGRTIPKA